MTYTSSEESADDLKYLIINSKMEMGWGFDGERVVVGEAKGGWQTMPVSDSMLCICLKAPMPVSDSMLCICLKAPYC